MFSKSKYINSKEIIARINKNDPIISRILSTKTSNYIEYIVDHERKKNTVQNNKKKN
jgi:hypothetical protein